MSKSELIFIIDESGSMHPHTHKTVEGFNSLIHKQHYKENDCRITTVFFNDEIHCLYKRKKLQNVQDIDEEDYCPNGTTALYDAIGITLDDFIWESDEDSKTLVFIITDGMENASYRYTLKDIKKKIVKLQKENHWEFIFMGANIDAYGVAGSIGIGKKRTVNYQNDDRGIKLNYMVMSDVAAKFIKNQEIDDDWHESIDQDFKSRR